jgi:hypothetical protein
MANRHLEIVNVFAALVCGLWFWEDLRMSMLAMEEVVSPCPALWPLFARSGLHSYWSFDS